jgi:uncharacterized protein
MTRRATRRVWFLPRAPDVLGQLVHQGEITVSGLEALDRWARGDPAAGDEVRASEHASDEARRVALTTLRRAFVTPVDPEDLFELSERLDRVMNQAKDLVREAELLAMAPDPPMAEMSRLALIGVRKLVEAFPVLPRTGDGATEAADAAIHQQREIEHVYRQAMSSLLNTDDLREVAGRRELYRRCSRMGDAVEHVANRIWYAVVKQG